MNSASATSGRFPSFHQWSPLGAFAGGVFALDLFIPLGVAAGVPYLFVILLGLRQRNSQLSILAAVGCTTLTVLGIFLSPAGGELWKVLVNRMLAIFAIWTTTLMGRVQLQQADTIQLRDKTIQNFMEIMPSACFTFDRLGTILSWNAAAEKIYGYSKEEAVGASSLDFQVSAQHREDTKKNFDTVFQGKAAESQLWHDRNKQGELGWRIGTLFPVFDEQGQVVYGVNISNDITPQKTAEDDLQNKTALLEALLHSSPDAIYVKDTTGKFLLVNQVAANFMGKPPENILGLDNTRLFDSLTARRLSRYDEIVLSHTRPITFEETLLGSDPPKTFSSTKFPLKNVSGKTIGLVGVSRDISDWKQTQKDLLLTDRVFMASPDHISILGRDYRYRRVNPTYQHAHGKSSHEIVGMSVFDLLGKEIFYQTVKPMLESCFQGKEVYYESWFTFAKNQRRYMAVSYLPLTEENQDIQEVVVIARDWTERKQIEIQLQSNEYRYRSLIETAGSMIIGLRPDGAIVEWNREAEQLFGKTRNEVLDQNYFDTFILGTDRLHMMADIKKVLTGKSTRDFHNFVKASDGTPRKISWNVDRLVNEQSQPYGVICVGRDITEWEKAQAQLQKWATIYQHTQWGVAVGEATNQTLDMVNEAYARMHGYTVEELQGQPISQVIAPEFRNQLPGIIQMVHERGSHSFESQHIRKDGTTFPALLNISAIKDADGKALYRVANIIDISALKETEQALRESKHIYHDLVQTIEGIVWECEFPSYQITFVSQFAEKLLGHLIQSWKTDPQFFLSLIHPDDRQRIAAYWSDATLRKENHVMEFRVVHANESILWVRAHVTIVLNNNQPVKLRGIMMDITEQKKIESDLKESEQRFRIMFEQAAVGVAQIASRTGEFVKINQRYCDILGYSQEEMHMKTDKDITHHEDLESDVDNMTRLLSGEIATFSMEKRYMQRSGRIVWINLTVSPMWRTEEEPSHHIAVVEDITERKQLENMIRQHNEELEIKVRQRAERIQELEQRRMQVEKLAALAQVAAGVAHEINNPLASISQSFVLLKRAIPINHPHFRYVEKVDDCIGRIAQITKHLYQLYRPGSSTPTPIDLRKPIQDAVEIMHERASKQQISITSTTFPTPVVSTVPSGELTQVLCNLLQNAIDASHHSKKVEVDLASQSDSFIISVGDYGPGIPQKVAPHIFEPFFTTKQGNDGGGMGLGLSISHSLVEAMGGTLDFSTTIGHGTTFRITLPLTLD